MFNNNLTCSEQARQKTSQASTHRPFGRSHAPHGSRQRSSLGVIPVLHLGCVFEFSQHKPMANQPLLSQPTRDTSF